MLSEQYRDAQSYMASGAPGYKMVTGGAEEGTSQGLSSEGFCEDS